MNSVVTDAHEVHFGAVAKAALQQYLRNTSYSKVFVLVDEMTKACCLGILEDFVDRGFDGVFCIKPGERYKNIETCVAVWEGLSDQGGDRKSLLINLGGGVVTDLGGFVASTFKRGIDFINIPTTLLAMVDASLGGKTGVDLGSLKNQVGIINQPKMVLIVPEFLQTLEARQRTSGTAEMFKHGLIADKTYWEDLRHSTDFSSEAHIRQSVQIKNLIVAQDPTEQNVRKKLNFGHTLGHAIESYFLEQPEKETLLHGEAIAIGMILEAFLSHKLTGLSMLEVHEIKATLLGHFNKVDMSRQEMEIILDLLKHDKKNTHGNINFVLLESIGNAQIDVKVPDVLFDEAFAYYKES